MRPFFLRGGDDEFYFCRFLYGHTVPPDTNICDSPSLHNANIMQTGGNFILHNDIMMLYFSQFHSQAPV
jgi:hypothetical protein